MPAIAWRDRVQETTTTQGTGNLLLAGATAGHQSFATAYGSNAAGIYVAVAEDGVGWEVLRCDYTHSTQVLSNFTVMASSTGGKQNWPPGTRVISMVHPASELMGKSESLSGIASPSEARTNLGATATGGALFTAASAAAGRTTLGATTVGSNVFTAADAAAARTALALGTLATQNEGTAAAQFRDNAANDARFEPRFPSGTELLFGSAPPTGWTRVDSTGDDELFKAAKSGESAGANGGNWATNPVAVLGHALTEAQLPAHAHSIAASVVTVGAGAAETVHEAFSTVPGDDTHSTAATGSNQAHAHSSTWSSAWRPRYRVLVRATKD